VAASEARLRLAIDTGQLAVWDLDPVADRLAGSPALNRFFGFAEDASPSPAELRARYAPGEAERLAALGAELRARGEDRVQTEIRLALPDGSERWLLMRAQVAPPEAGMGNRVLGVLLDITEAKRRQQRMATVAGELRHRMKNLVSVVQVLVSRSLAAGSDPAAARQAIAGRLQALGAAIELMQADELETAELGALVGAIVGPHRPPGRDPFDVSGAPVTLRGAQISSVALALHELGTNATKYGALSVPGGRVAIAWRTEAGVLRLDWTETGGPPVAPPLTEGFGTVLLRRGLLSAPDVIELEFREEGLACRMALRLG
jgi:PAS domain S-box-containing protein